MKKWVPMVIVLILLGWAVYDFIDTKNNQLNVVTNEEGEVLVGLDVGYLAPDFELETLNEDVVKLSDFRGERIMINFWASWCGPCRSEMPDMEKFYQDKDVTILAVNVTNTERKMDHVIDFIDEINATYPILLDKNRDVSNLYKIQPLPTTFMVDSNGIINFKTYGAMNYDLMVQEFEKME